MLPISNFHANKERVAPVEGVITTITECINGLRSHVIPIVRLRVLNLLSRVGSEPEREELKGYKKNINTGASSWWGAKAKVEGNAEEVLLCSREVEDLLFNAEVFRTGTDRKKDEEKRRLWQQIEKYGPVWQHSFLRYAMTVVHYAYRLAESIRTKGYAEKCPAVAEYWAQPTHDLEEASGESRAATLPD